MARPQKCRCICSKPKITGFQPEGFSDNAPGISFESVNIGFDEYEVIRLLDYERKTQEECARKMAVSRPTVTRMYNEARGKIADALVNGKQITVGGGDVTVCEAMRPECVHEKHCCHRF